MKRRATEPARVLTMFKFESAEGTCTYVNLLSSNSYAFYFAVAYARLRVLCGKTCEMVCDAGRQAAQPMLHGLCLYVYTPLLVFLPSHPVRPHSCVAVDQGYSARLDALHNPTGVFSVFLTHAHQVTMMQF